MFDMNSPLQSRTAWIRQLLAYMAMALVICVVAPPAVNGQIAYVRHLSDLRTRELHNIANRMEHSINRDKFACESYYDYVCSRNRPLYSVLGHLPEFDELLRLTKELQDDGEQFEAKRKLMDFFISCNEFKMLEECYYETFEYFKPLYGYIITKNYIDSSAHEYREVLELLQRFLKKAGDMEEFARNPLRMRLGMLADQFRMPHQHFRAADLDSEYSALRINRASYKHNVLALEQHRRRNSTYESGVARTMLDWSLYVFQSRSKPMSYYFATFNVHLWMSLYNSTEHMHDATYFKAVGECLMLPQFVNVLDEARIMAVVYLKSFRNAWKDYHDWRMESSVNQEIYNRENHVLRPYDLNNKRLFFTLYGQNFCDFGKELAEHVFYLGMKYNQDFYSIYSCGYHPEATKVCV